MLPQSLSPDEASNPRSGPHKVAIPTCPAPISIRLGNCRIGIKRDVTEAMPKEANGPIAKTAPHDTVDPVTQVLHIGGTKHLCGSEPDVIRPPEGHQNRKSILSRARPDALRSQARWWRGEGPAEGSVTAIFAIWCQEGGAERRSTMAPVAICVRILLDNPLVVVVVAS